MEHSHFESQKYIFMTLTVSVSIRELRQPKGVTPALKRIALSPGCEYLAS